MKRNALTMFMLSIIALTLLSLLAGCGGHNKIDTPLPGGGNGSSAWKWEFNESDTSFQGNNSIVTITGGSLVQTVTSGTANSFLLSPDNLALDAGTHKYIKIRVKNNFSTAGILAVQWITTLDDPDTGWDSSWSSGTKSYLVSATGVSNDGQFHDYMIDLSAQANWTGTIRRVRIKLTPNTAPEDNLIEVDYIRITDVPDEYYAKAWEFNTDGNVESFGGNKSTVTSVGGSLVQTVTATTTNSFLLSSDNLGINASTHKYLKIRAKNKFSTAGILAVQWNTTTDTTWDTTWTTGTKSYIVSATGVPSDGQFHDYVIDLSAQPNWTGTINRLRIKLTPDTAPEENSVEVDYIRVSNVRK